MEFFGYYCQIAAYPDLYKYAGMLSPNNYAALCDGVSIIGMDAARNGYTGAPAVVLGYHGDRITAAKLADLCASGLAWADPYRANVRELVAAAIEVHGVNNGANPVPML